MKCVLHQETSVVFEELYQYFSTSLQNANTIVVIGISGNMGCGKSYFCREFKTFLENKGIHVIHWDQDWYQVSRAEREHIIMQLRKKGINDPLELSKRTYFDTILWNEMIAHLVQMKERKDIPLGSIYNKSTGNRDSEIELSFTHCRKPVWVLYDGGFIMHGPIRDQMDSMLVVESSAEQRFQNMATRALNLAKPYKLDPTRFAELDTFTTWYLTANRASSDIILDNTDLMHPRILFPQSHP